MSMADTRKLLQEYLENEGVDCSWMKLAERDDGVVSLTFTTKNNMEDLVDNDFINDFIDVIADELDFTEINIIICGMVNGHKATYKIHSNGSDISVMKAVSDEWYLLSDSDFEISDYDDDAVGTACLSDSFSDDVDNETFYDIYDDSEDADNIPGALLQEMKRDFTDVFGDDEEGPCDRVEDSGDVQLYSN